MTLDIRTIVVLLLVSAVLMTATLSAGIRGSRAPGLAKWNIGLGLFALGWLLIASRELLHPAISVALADGLLLEGLCFQLTALHEFDGRPAHPGLLALPGPALALLILPLLGDYSILTLVSSTCYALALSALAWRVMRLGREGAGPVRWLVGPALIAGAFSLVARAADIALAPEQVPGIYTTSVLHTFAFVMLFAITVMASFAFLVMQRHRAESELRRLAMFDALTGLFNRRAFMELAERELARLARSGTPFAALMIDLDHFKRVNDAHGHQAGDRVLAEFSERALRCMRAGDLLGRYGGEEFCALLPATSTHDAMAIAGRIREILKHRPLGGLPSLVTVSIGVASCDSAAGVSLDEVLARADRALYQAKAAGRDRVVSSPGLGDQPDPSRHRLGKIDAWASTGSISLPLHRSSAGP